MILFLIGLLLFQFPIFAEESSEGMSHEWKADYYERDNRTNTLRGRGHAWYKQGAQQIWADELEIGFDTNWAYATGNAHFSDGLVDIYCDRGSYALSGTEAVLEEATVISGQMVLSGSQIRKLTKDQFEMDEGYYTNCNTIPLKDRSAATCPYDWKIYGKHFKVTLEGYAHVYDAIVYTKELPMLYFPYYMAPAKSKRQSGLLWMQAETGRDIGSGFGIPYFQVLGPWHDLTFYPTLYSKAGLHLGTQYTYAYSKTKEGIFTFWGSQIKYREDNRTERPFFSKSSGLGEYAINLENRYSLGERSHSRQQIRLVSDPYYPIDFPKDLGSHSSFSGLRSQITATSPDDNHLVTGQVTHFQSLVMSEDSGVDRGGVTQLPTLSFYRKTSPSPLRFLSYEIDTKFSNFYRPELPFDSLPDNRSGTNSDPPGSSTYRNGDYVREGQRFFAEPRAVLTFPIATGMQLQPVVKGGSLLYHFDVPTSTYAKQFYVDTEIPFQMYLAKNFETGIKGLEHVRHIFQPRVIYAVSLYRSEEPSSTNPSHPFFKLTPLSNPEAFSNPRFDILDQTTPFEYMRLELNNRFWRDVNGTRERFLTLQVSNQLNSRRSDFDRRYEKKIGPIDMLIDFAMAPIGIQLQGSYNIEKTNDRTHESDWSGTFSYAFEKDRISLSGLYQIRDNPANDAHNYTLGFYKTLPVFVDLTGNITYNALKQLHSAFERYEVGLMFASKPVSCWTLGALYTKNVGGESYARFVFGLNFGGTFSFSSSSVNM